VVLDELALRGELPRWLSGSLLRTGPAKFEVGEQRMRHWFDGLGDAAPLHDRRRTSVIRQPVPGVERVPGSEGAGQDLLSRVRDRPLPLPVQAGPDAVRTRTGDLRERQRQRDAPRRALRCDDRDAASHPVRRPDTACSGHPLPGAGRADDGSPAPRPRDGRHAQLRSEARPAEQLPLLRRRSGRRRATGDRLAGRVGARLYALLRPDRALARAGGVPVRGEPARARAVGPAVHRELPVEARARYPASRSWTGRPGAPRRRCAAMPASRSTTSTPSSRGTR